MVYQKKVEKFLKRVKYLLVAVDILLKFVRVQTTKTKYAKDTLDAFRKMIFRKNTPEIFGLIKEQSMGELLKNFARRKTLKFTFSLWNIWYISLPWKSSWKNCPQSAAVCFYIELSQKSIKWKISQRCEKQWFFLSILCNKSFKKYTKPKFKIGVRVKKSKNDIPFRKRCKPQFTDEVFEISAISTKHLLHTSSKISKKKKFWEKFYENEQWKCSD